MILSIVMILLIHFLADFGLQTHEQATRKSMDNKQLAYHVGVYTAVWFVAGISMFGDIQKTVTFALITFICHFLTDYVTSRIGKPYWEKKDFHNAFVIVGFDQLLHYVQLFLTYIWLI